MSNSLVHAQIFSNEHHGRIQISISFHSEKINIVVPKVQIVNEGLVLEFFKFKIRLETKFKFK